MSPLGPELSGSQPRKVGGLPVLGTVGSPRPDLGGRDSATGRLPVTKTCHQSQNYQAFRAEVERGEAAAPLFEELLKTGTPAAKLYSALGLYHLDRERGVKALQSLSGDTTKVSEMNGCMVDETTVGATAKMLLGDNEAVARAYLPR